MTISADRPSPATDMLARSRAARTLWMLLGIMLVGVGFVGLFVPLLPTTDFLILALPCFARSSQRLEAWLLYHPRFGPSLRAWRTERAVPRQAKIAAWVGIASGYALFYALVRPGWLPALAVAAAMIASALWIVRRPSPGNGA